MVDLENMTLPFGLNYERSMLGVPGSSSIQQGGFDGTIDINIMKHVFGGKNAIHKTIEPIKQNNDNNKSRKSNINNIKNRSKSKLKSRTKKKIID